MHTLAIVASVLLICACVVASVLLAVYQSTKTAPLSPPDTPPVPPSDATPRAPASTVATTTAHTKMAQGVVISTTEIPNGQPGYFYHEGPEVVSSRSVMVDGVEVELPPDEDPPNYGLND